MDPLDYELKFLENVDKHEVGVINDASINTNKIANSAITTDKLADGSVLVNKLNVSSSTVPIGTVQTSTITTPTSTVGIELNTLNNNVYLTFADWKFDFEGGILTPINRTRQVFNATGADQTFTVPAGVTRIFVKMWGAGGGNGRQGGWSYGAAGGGGGHTRGLISVTPGESLTVRVGVGGMTVVFGSSFGGGGGAGQNADLSYGGQGGGGTYLFRSTTPLLIAGGGGGGGSSRAWDGNVGGAGGGLTGQRGESPYDGKANFGGGGGTQTAGGASVGTAGSLYQGGVANTNSYGGGGGGGYYGGGGGAYSESNTMGGGGGGSGFVVSSAIFGDTYAGAYRVPALHWDNDLPKNTHNASKLYATSVAYGAQNLQNNVGGGTQTGGDGIVIMYY